MLISHAARIGRNGAGGMDLQEWSCRNGPAGMELQEWSWRNGPARMELEAERFTSRETRWNLNYISLPIPTLPVVNPPPHIQQLMTTKKVYSFSQRLGVDTMKLVERLDRRSHDVLS